MTTSYKPDQRDQEMHWMLQDIARLEKAIRKLAMDTANLDVLEILDGKEKKDDEAGN